MVRVFEESEFATVLRESIASRGLSLEQLRKALERRGVRVSVATLSYWQSGRSRPERSSSLAAIGPLEACLGLPRGFLASRLPAARRWDTEELPYEYGVLPVAGRSHIDHIDLAMAQLDLSHHDTDWVVVHDRVSIDADGAERSHDVRLLLRARRDGVDRYPVWFEASEPVAIPVVTAVTNCRVGRVREFPDSTGVAVEMVMDRALQQGETALVEHRQAFVGPQEGRGLVWRRVATPSREVVLDVSFEGPRLPVEARAASVVGGRREERRVPVARTIQAHFVDNAAGRFEIEWSW